MAAIQSLGAAVGVGQNSSIPHLAPAAPLRHRTCCHVFAPSLRRRSEHAAATSRPRRRQRSQSPPPLRFAGQEAAVVDVSEEEAGYRELLQVRWCDWAGGVRVRHRWYCIAVLSKYHSKH